MAAEFSLPLTAEGAVTAPSGSLDLTVPTAESETFFDIGPINVLEIPEFGFVTTDGVNPMRLFTRGSVLDAGGIAPSAALTAASTGTKATSTLTDGTATDFADGDLFTINSSFGVMAVQFKTTLGVGDLGDEAIQIKRGTSFANSISNLQDAIESTGTEGTEYHSGYIFNHGGTSTNFKVLTGIEYDSKTATTFVFRAANAGADGNSIIITEGIDSGNVYAISAFTGGVSGSGTAPAKGTFRYFYTWYRESDGAETGRSPITTMSNTEAQGVSIGALTASADTSYDYINIYRTPVQGVEFYLAGAAPKADTTFSDTMSDDTLVRGDAWNDLLHRAYAEGGVPRGRAIALMDDGSLWTVGAHLHADYTAGTVAVTVDSATITFSIQGVSTRMVGRTFIVASTSEEYTVLSISESGPTGVIDRLYEGTTNGTATFKIKDDYDAARLRRCVPFKYNQWPVDESPGRVPTDDPEGGTALLATANRLFAFSATSIISVTGDGPETWDINKVADGIGCVAPSMVVGVEGGGVFLSRSGFYALSPDESVLSISSPKTPKRALARGIDDTIARIAWANVDQGYSAYDPVDRVVIFGVPLDGAITPNYEFIFDIQNGTWSLYKRAEWTALTQIELPGGGRALLAGDRNGNVWHANIGESDGFYGTEAVQTLTGAQTTRVLTVSGTPFSTSEEGKPVIVLYADGVTVAYGKVASSTTSALTLEEDLTTAPAASDQIVLGGIAWQAKSGFTTFGEEYRTKTLRSVTVRHDPATRGDYFLSFAVNDGSFILAPVGTSIGDLTDTDGKIRHKTQWPGDSHAINLRGFKPGGRAKLRGGVFDIVIRENGRV